MGTKTMVMTCTVCRSATLLPKAFLCLTCNQPQHYHCQLQYSTSSSWWTYPVPSSLKDGLTGCHRMDTNHQSFLSKTRRWWSWWEVQPVGVVPSVDRSRCSLDQEEPTQALSPDPNHIWRPPCANFWSRWNEDRIEKLGWEEWSWLTSSKKSSAVSCALRPSFCSFLHREINETCFIF